MNKSNGFTLIELMVTIAVASILLTIAIPSMSQFILSSRITSNTNDMAFLVSLSKSEAIKRRKEVTLQRKGSGTGNDWSNGAIVYIDDNSNSVLDSGEDRIYETGALQTGMFIKVIAPSTNQSQIKFSPRGGLSGNVAYQFGICTTRAGFPVSRQRLLDVRVSGRASVSVPTTNPC